jgi:hypothetical protein
MPYTITLTNGTPITTIADATVDTTTSLTLLGKNYPGYGTILADNLVHLLENSANITAPSAPLVGQLWYNTNAPAALNVWNGSAWIQVGATTGQPINASYIVEGTTAQNVGFVNWDPSSPNNSRYYRIRTRDDGSYAGHWVLESLFNNSDGSMGGVQAVCLDTTPTGYVKLAATPASNDNSTAIATTAFVTTAVAAETTARTAAVSAAQTTLQNEINALNVRILATGTLNLYVSPTGSDTANTGLTSSSPFATMQKAWNLVVSKYDLNGFGVVINLANGTYTSQLNISSLPLGISNSSTSQVTINGNTSSPSSVVISTTNSFNIVNNVPLSLAIQGVSMTASGSVNNIAVGCINVNSGGIVNITGPVIFNSAASFHVWLGADGHYTILSSYTIAGNAQVHLYAGGSGAFVNIGSTTGGYTITFSGSITFSSGFVYATQGGSITLFYSAGPPAIGVQFAPSGNTSCSGPRFGATLNGTISTAGGGNGYLPGSSNGVLTTGGQIA